MNIEILAKKIYNSRLKGELDAGIIEHYASEILSSVYEGYGSFLDEINDVQEKILVQTLAGNVYRFSGAKSFHELVEFNNILVDDKGKIRKWEEYRDLVKKTHTTYNEHYLRTERQYALNTSQMIKRWNEYQAEKDVAPYLRFVAVLDDRTRDSHAKFHDLVRHIDDPIWDILFTPLDWNCRCDIIQEIIVTMEELSRSIPEIDIPEAFRFNPAKEKKIFSDKTPYFKHFPKEKKELLSFKNLSHLLADNELLKKLAIKENRTEVKQWVKENIVGTSFKTSDGRDFVMSSRSMKSVISHRHDNEIEKNSLLYDIEKVLKKSKYQFSAKPNNVNSYEVAWHYYKYAEGYYLNFRELVNGELQLYAISDKIKKEE